MTGYLQRLNPFIYALCALGGAWFIVAFVMIALLSIHYPYQLEWMEGQTIDVIARIIAGKSMYVEPTIEYVPFIYPPLYYYICALVANYVGLDFFAARLVSLISALGVGFLLFAWVRREGGDRKTSLIAAGLFYATYELSSRWFDVARIDSLYVLLAMSALYVFIYHQHARGAILSGLLFTAAFFTKQNTLIIALPLMLVGMWQMRRHTMQTVSVFALATLGIFTAYNAATDGWLYFYLFDLPSSHRIDSNFIVGFWWKDLWLNLWPLMLLCVFGWVSIFRDDKRKAMLYLGLAAGLVAAAYAGRLHRYGWSNVLIPAHFTLALCSVLVVVWWQKQHKAVLQTAGLATIFAQMALLLYNPIYDIPDAEARAQGDAFLQRIAQIDGDVFMPEIQFVQTRVGKKSYSYGVAAVDIYQSAPAHRAYVKGKLRAEMAAAIKEQRFAAIVTSRLIGLPKRDAFYARSESIDYPAKFVSGYVAGRPLSIMLPLPPSRLRGAASPYR